MTFLEYVCHRLIGKPVSGSCWRCPFCFSTGGSFFVRTQQQKFKCYRCCAWGDACDLLKLFHPQDDYGKRLERLRELQDDYDRESGVFVFPGSTRRQVAANAAALCEKFGMHPAAFAEWVRELETEHLAECRDPECDTVVCRAARGLPPLTEAELAAADHQRAMERARKVPRQANVNGRI